MESGRFDSQRDMSGTIFSNLNSPSESFRMTRWTPRQGSSAGESAAPASDSLPSTSASTPAKEIRFQAGSSGVVDIPGSSSCRFTRDLALDGHSPSLQGNSNFSPCSTMGSRCLFFRQNSDSRTYVRSAGGNRQRALLDCGQNSQGSLGQQAGATDWSMQTFSQLVASSKREGFSLSGAHGSSEVSLNVNEDGEDQCLPSSGSIERLSISPSQAMPHMGNANPQIELQKCSLCSRWLLHWSPWSSHRMLGSNDLPVVSVLVCGHVYHADCLEKAVPDSLRLDPPCPQCDQMENVNLKAPLQFETDGVKGTSEPFKRKLSRIGPQFQRKSFLSGKPYSLVDADGRKGSVSLSASNGEKMFFPRSFSKKQFSFRGKSGRDSSALTIGSKKTSSPAQVTPDNQNL